MGRAAIPSPRMHHARIYRKQARSWQIQVYETQIRLITPRLTPGITRRAHNLETTQVYDEKRAIRGPVHVDVL